MIDKNNIKLSNPTCESDEAFVAFDNEIPFSVINKYPVIFEMVGNFTVNFKLAIKSKYSKLTLTSQIQMGKSVS